MRFAINEKYYLHETEKQIKRDTSILKIYDKYNNNLEHQVPLEKVIKTNNYYVFFGVAVTDDAQSMYKFYIEDTSHFIYEHKITEYKKKKIYHFFVKNNDDFNYKIIYNTKKLTVVINITSPDSSLINNFYNNPNFIQSKFNK